MWISWRTKIRRRRFKERVKLIKMLHSGKDLLKTSEDIVPESLEILHLDGRDGVSYTHLTLPTKRIV